LLVEGVGGVRVTDMKLLDELIFGVISAMLVLDIVLKMVWYNGIALKIQAICSEALLTRA
jgi:hypothetical protein